MEQAQVLLNLWLYHFYMNLFDIFIYYLEIGCAWITYIPETGFCELLSNCTILDTSHCKDCISAQSNCIPDEPTCWVEGRRQN